MPRPTSSARRVRRELARDPPLVERHDPVGEGVDLVELGRDQQHGAPVGLLVQDLAPDELDRADVEAARGLRGDAAASGRSRARARGSASAGCRPRACPPSRRCCARARRRARPAASRARLIFLMNRTPPRRENSVVVLAAQEAFSHSGHVEHEPLPVPVLGDEPDPGVADAPPCRRPPRSLPARRTGRPSSGRRPMMASASSRWPLPSTPATPRISPARTSRSSPWSLPAAQSPSTLEHRLADLDVRLLEAEQHGPADHHLGELAPSRSPPAWSLPRPCPAAGP